MLSTDSYDSRSVPTELAAVNASLPQFSSDRVELSDTGFRLLESPFKVWYQSAAAPTETGLEWMFPKTPPLHLLDLRNRL